MHPPIETTATTVERRGDILRITSKGVQSTRETLAETFGAVTAVTGEERLPVLFDARAWPGGTRDAWAALIETIMTAFSAAAVLIDPGQDDSTGAFGEGIDRLLIPFRVFTEEQDAVAFLEGQRA